MTKLNILSSLPKDGLHIVNSNSLESTPSDLLNATAIILEFPTFMDGRAFSQARRLRRNGYKGDLIASGDIRADQARQYAQVGFSSLHFQESFDPHIIENDLARYPASYQHSSLDWDVIYQKRIDEHMPHFSGGGPF